MRVLVADDDGTVRRVLEPEISSWGYDVELASDGNEAWQVLSGSDPPRIAILDWLMPGKDGVEICRDLQNRLEPFIYRLLLTAKSERHDLLYALDNGAHDFQTKPIEFDILRARLSVAVRLVEAKDEVLRAERMAAVTTLVRGIAHQFNNLNATTLGFVELLLKDPGLQPKQQQRLDRILEATHRARDITSRLLSLAAPRLPLRQPEPLHRIAHEAVGLVLDDLASKGIEVERDLAEVPPVSLNPNGITEVLLHLLSNAEHSVLGRDEKRITVETGATDDHVFVRIRDTGCGIAPNGLHSVFTPFFGTKGEHAEPGSIQAEVKGLGLGLSVSESIVRQHGGSLTAESAEDKGSVFTVWLPRSG
jgi:signal transduction histidine kinase